MPQCCFLTFRAESWFTIGRDFHDLQFASTLDSAQGVVWQFFGQFSEKSEWKNYFGFYWPLEIIRISETWKSSISDFDNEENFIFRGSSKIPFGPLIFFTYAHLAQNYLAQNVRISCIIWIFTNDFDSKALRISGIQYKVTKSYSNL